MIIYARKINLIGVNGNLFPLTSSVRNKKQVIFDIYARNASIYILIFDSTYSRRLEYQ